MDAIVALCHFCESHGPCVILCTQRTCEQPQKTPHSLTAPWCEACQSVDVDQALVSKENNILYVTTRTPQQQNLSFLLKQAAIRSLSCEEETSKEGGTLYFGDNERGHVISHGFTIRDSLARGFYRKYSILVLSRDKIHLLNSWPTLVANIKQLVDELQTKANAINGAEQVQRPQRAVRQAAGVARSTSRSLSQLTGQPAVFGHLHLWFCWMLAHRAIVEQPTRALPVPALHATLPLRAFAHKCDPDAFSVVCFCVLTGVDVGCEDGAVVDALATLLPQSFPLRKSVSDNMYHLRRPAKVTHNNSTVVIRNESFTDTVDTPHVDSLGGDDAAAAAPSGTSFSVVPLWSPLWSPVGGAKGGPASCVVVHNEGAYVAHWAGGKLPARLPTLQVTLERAIRNAALPDAAYEPYVHALTLKWLRVAQVLMRTRVRTRDFLHTLDVQSCDLALVNYWIYMCRRMEEKEEKINV